MNWRRQLANTHRLLTPTTTALAVVLSTAACNNLTDTPRYTEPTSPTPELAEYSLRQFDDCSHLRGYVTDMIIEQHLANHYGGGTWVGWGGWGRGDVLAEAEGGDDGAPSAGNDQAPDNYTGTNNQVDGVDELDFVKTDGSHIYLARGNKLRIVKSFPASEARELAELDLGEDAFATGLFISGDRAVVMQQVWDYDDNYYGGVEPAVVDARAEGDEVFVEPTEPERPELNDDGTALRGYQRSRLTVLDISDRANPVVQHTIDLEGGLVNARLIDDKAYIAMNSGAVYELLSPYLWQLQLPYPEWDENTTEESYQAELEELREEAREIVEPYVNDLLADLDGTQLLPRASANGGDAEPLMGCSDVYYPSRESQASYLSLVELDLGSDSADLDAASVLAGGWTVYATADSFYMALPGWAFVDGNEKTQIHRFGMDDQFGPYYAATGEVDGFLLNQFAMDEWDDHLRVATTLRPTWGPVDGTDEWGQLDDGGSNVFVLKENADGLLRETGSVTGIAPGEQITAVRFMGEKGYVVTFEQIDPLFTLDLFDHGNPQLRGELKIPGFSNYLHPLEDGYLLAIGMDGTDEGQITGVQVSIFDVRNMNNPTRFDALTLTNGGWSFSEANSNHHAFTYRDGVLAVPLSGEDWERGISFHGMSVIDVSTSTGLSERGRIEHDFASEEKCYEYEPGFVECYVDNWGTNIERSIFIEDNLVSISNRGILFNDLNNPDEELGRVEFSIE